MARSVVVKRRAIRKRRVAEIELCQSLLRKVQKIEGTVDAPLSADELYTNQKIRDLVDKAEMERTDYRDDQEQNVFFGTRRTFERPAVVNALIPPTDPDIPPGPLVISTLNLNRLVLIAFITLALALLYLNLRRKLTRVT